MIRPPSVNDLDKLVDLSIRHAMDAGYNGHDDVNRTYWKKQLREMMISPTIQIFVAEQQGQMVGYVIGSINEKIWNGKRYGEINFIYIDRSIRNKLLLDDLFISIERWFLENNCVYMQASVMGYDEEFLCSEEFVDKACNYFHKRHEMNEVGYHFVKSIGRDEWAE